MHWSINDDNIRELTRLSATLFAGSITASALLIAFESKSTQTFLNGTVLLNALIYGALFFLFSMAMGVVGQLSPPTEVSLRHLARDLSVGLFAVGTALLATGVLALFVATLP